LGNISEVFNIFFSADTAAYFLHFLSGKTENQSSGKKSQQSKFSCSIEFRFHYIYADCLLVDWLHKNRQQNKV